ncbi:MAG TPA: carboxypeptidase-like regulatory domain-containing protein [Vicinamibacterales bacterium]|nr:carboxypeptidase-like regulatory domain-containing protein [Vicinamibacterales bacterium]
MRTLWIIGFLLLLAGIPTLAQETRGTISGTVRDAQGVVPGATVKITNVDTDVTQPVVTNNGGYFEAPLLRAGTYRLTIEMTGFKTLDRTGITLAGGQQLSLQLELELGTIAETVTVTGDAPVLETNTVRTGLNFTQRQIEDLPVQSNMPIMLTRFAPGLSASPSLVYAGQGYVGGPSTSAIPLGGVGGNEWTIDGATNNGVNRQMATSPNSDMLQEMRVETTNFAATIGHGTGVGISMMTRAGTNTPRGTTNYQYWSNKINAANVFQEAVFAADPKAKAAFEAGYSHNFAVTYGGPIQIPKIVDGRNKLFMFLNYAYGNDNYYGKAASTRTIPASAKQLAGDFSDLLNLPNGSQYQIYDPLTTRPDPARPGHVIRDPFPGNIIPADRITNPLYKFYRDTLPDPNQNPTSSSVAPVNNYYDAAEPDPLRSHVWGARVDYNYSDKNRFFFRTSGSHFTEDANDWTYINIPTDLNGFSRLRKTWTDTGTWTHVSGETVIDAQLSANRFLESDRRFGLKKYKPSSVGLPTYLDDFCLARGNFGGTTSCQLPAMTITGYGAGGAALFSNNSGTYDQSTNYQGQVNLSQVRGSHTLKGGVDVREAQRIRNDPGFASGNFTFNNTYTRKADDTTVYPAADLGLSWAAFMLGMPTTVAADSTAQYHVKSPWVGTYVQDTWRMSSNVTLTGGFRYEYEDGNKEVNDAMLVGFDPNALLSISKLAEAAYAANPIPELSPSNFKVVGGSIYANSPGQTGKSWKGQSMLMPRAYGAWTINDKTVLKSGYGMYYDTLNATAFAPVQSGFSQTTTSNLSVDFGQTWLLGDPKNGVSPMLNPFPVVNGTRFQSVLGSSLGADSILGTSFSATSPLDTPNRERARVQRTRTSLQREISHNMSVEIAFNTSYGDHLPATIRQDYLPEQWWNGSNVRDLTQQNLLNANVANPFYIGNFASLQTSNPALYAKMAGNSFFTSPTIQKNRLLRPYPQMSNGNGLSVGNLPLGKNRAQSIEVTLSRRFANGFSGNIVYTGLRAEELTTVNEYDQTPWLWQTQDNAKPHRVTAQFLAEFPFGRSRRFLSDGGVLGAIFGGWQTGGTFEYQSGPLLQWSGSAIGNVSNIFFYGDLKNIAVKNPTVDRWFNVDAGFETDPLKAAASFQKRTFPFRIDGVRGPNLMLLNMNFVRNVPLPAGKTLQLRVDMLNALNRMHYGTPDLNPVSTQFGKITTAPGTIMRFVTFVLKLNF